MILPKKRKELVLTRPFRGFLTILTVGPSNRLLPFALASLANNPPAKRTNPGSNVAPKAVPHGKQLALDGRKWEDPRTPLGPSDIFMGGIPSRGTPEVVHQSDPCQTASTIVVIVIVKLPWSLHCRHVMGHK